MRYLGIVTTAMLAVFANAAAAAFPEKPVKIIVPFAAGGSNDILGRYIGDRLSKLWNQPVVVENMPGAGAAIGSAHVAKAKPDGHTLLIASVTFTMNPPVQKNLPFDPATDFTPVAMLGKVPLILLVGPAVPAKSFEEFLEIARSRDLAYATSGLGTVNQFGAELVNRGASIKMTPVHYKGGSEAMTDVIGGHVDLFMSSMTQALPLIRGGQMRGLVVTSSERSDVAPDVPTLDESGIPDADIEQWWGVMAPANTPAEIVEKINSDINRVLSTDETKAFLARDGGRPTPMAAPAFASFIKDELRRWKQVADEAGIKAE